MATSFLTIYTRAMTMLKSPLLSRLQNTNLENFCFIMNGYLQTAITFYNPNAATYTRVTNIQDQNFGSEDFVGDGISTSFALSEQENSDTIFSVTLNGLAVSNYTYNSTNNSIVFEIPPISQSQISVSFYNNGVFLGDITSEDITLLAIATCWAWAIQDQNDQLDIDRSLNDSGDFKQHSNATTLNSKVNWVKHYEEMYKRELSKADWRPLFRQV